MDNITNIQKLYEFLSPALNVKLRLLRNRNYFYIKKEDIWLYLKETKWPYSKGLTIADMVNDIIHCDNQEIDLYLKEKISKLDRSILKEINV
ncbi:unknown [Clostridium sp. CAG:762]|nr:unknown [Clostridium sp. CAG:762]